MPLNHHLEIRGTVIEGVLGENFSPIKIRGVGRINEQHGPFIGAFGIFPHPQLEFGSATLGRHSFSEKIRRVAIGRTKFPVAHDPIGNSIGIAPGIALTFEFDYVVLRTFSSVRHSSPLVVVLTHVKNTSC
jgi:hypothetical protein